LSSHHIVKENQEPALIIANGESCSFELLGQLLEWSPKVIVLDNAIERVLKLGIKADVVIGDFDSIVDKSLLQNIPYPIEILHDSNQNTTDLEKALFWLCDNNFSAANIVWATGKRSDHTLNNFQSLFAFKNKLDLVVLDDYTKAIPVKNKYERYYAKNTIISLIPFGLVKSVKTEGLYYELNHEDLESGIRSGSSNFVKESGLVEISHEAGNLLLIESKDNVY
jgi:thiamine pyrophosphokinase